MHILKTVLFHTHKQAFVFVPGGRVFIKVVNKVPRFLPGPLVTDSITAYQIHQSHCLRPDDHRTKQDMGLDQEL